MINIILTTLGITSPILVLCSIGLYLFLRKYINDRFEIVKNEQIELYKQNLQKDYVIFEHRKNGLSNILKLFSETLVSIKAKFDYQDGLYYLISEKDCDKFEIRLSENILFVNESTSDILNFVIRILRKNSDFIEKATGEQDSYFEGADLSILNYIYEKLVIIFRKELLEVSDEINVEEIKYMEIAFMMKHFYENDSIKRKELDPFNYTTQPIMEAINTIKASKPVVTRILKEIIKKYEEDEYKSEYRYLSMQKANEYVLFLEK